MLVSSSKTSAWTFSTETQPWSKNNHSVSKYRVMFCILWKKRYKKTSEPHKKTGLDRVFFSIYLRLFPILKPRRCTQIRHFYTFQNTNRRSLQTWEMVILSAIAASEEILQPMEKSFSTSCSNSRKWNNQQRRYRKCFRHDDCQSSRRKQSMEAVSEKRWGKREFKLWNWLQTSQRTKKSNIEQAKQRLQETLLISHATTKSTASEMGL